MPDLFPLPRIEDVIDEVGRATYVSKFDFLKDYYLIRLSRNPQDLASLVKPHGLFLYKGMPFGLRKASATFQHMINHVIAGFGEVRAYIDDIIVLSNTWKEHMQLLEELFKNLDEVNFTINLSKSEFD